MQGAVVLIGDAVRTGEWVHVALAYDYHSISKITYSFIVVYHDV